MFDHPIKHLSHNASDLTIARYDLAEANTHFFICGSANMAEECKTILGEIASPDRLNAIDEDGRIHCDVFGALTIKK